MSETAVQRSTRLRFWSLSERELQGQLVVLAFVLWGLAALNTLTPGLRDRSGRVKGADFVHFYVIGALVAEGHPDLLYDIQAQRLEQKRLIPGSQETWFVPIYGPQTALLFAPFSRLPYLWAASVWAVMTALVYGGCVWIFWRDCPSLHVRKRLVALAAIAFPPFWSLISHGQTSALALLCVAGAWLALRVDRRWWAGLALGSLIIKPQLGVAIAVVMIARREWRVVGAPGGDSRSVGDCDPGGWPDGVSRLPRNATARARAGPARAKPFNCTRSEGSGRCCAPSRRWRRCSIC
jgi:hypothetical protein